MYFTLAIYFKIINFEIFEFVDREIRCNDDGYVEVKIDFNAEFQKPDIGEVIAKQRKLLSAAFKVPQENVICILRDEFEENTDE